MEAGALYNKVFFKEDGESPSRGRNYERLVFGKETRFNNFASSEVISYKSVVKPYRIREQPFSLAMRDLSVIILLYYVFIFSNMQVLDKAL